MLFNSFLFPFFFLVVYVIYRLLGHKAQNRMLLVASYLFYGCWDWRFLGLIFLSTITDFYCGKKIASHTEQKKRKRYLLLSLFVNLSALGFFKYFNFFVENLQALLTPVGITLSYPTLNIILPIGISFYTFQTLSYTIDIYRKEMEPEKDFLDFSLFVAFFPQLVAGPIERAKRLLPQIKFPRVVTQEQNREGLWFIFWGYFLKVFVADNLAVLVDQIFAQTGVIPGTEVLVGAYAFAFQLFGDFAGYSFIAIGLAKLLGFNLMTNFLYPYLVTNPKIVWAHWHVSLSTWFRDYLYRPLRQSKIFSKSLFICVLITMLLGGLWHGAAWNYIIWGLYEALILCIWYALKPFHSKIIFRGKAQKVQHLFYVIFMFHVTCFGILIFRCTSVEQIVAFTTSLFFHMRDSTNFSGYAFRYTLFYSFLFIVIQIIQKKKGSLMAIPQLKAWQAEIFYVLMFYCITLFGNYGATEFIYFQF